MNDSSNRCLSRFKTCLHIIEILNAPTNDYDIGALISEVVNEGSSSIFIYT